MARKPQRWSDMPRAQKYAFVQSEVLFWTLYLVAAVLVFTKLGVAAGLFLTVPALLLVLWMAITLRRRSRRRGGTST